VELLFVAPAGGDQQIQVAIAVIICPGTPVRIPTTTTRDGRAAGDAGHGAVAVVAVEVIVLAIGVRNVEVWEAVVVVVAPRCPYSRPRIIDPSLLGDRRELTVSLIPVKEIAGWTIVGDE